MKSVKKGRVLKNRIVLSILCIMMVLAVVPAVLITSAPKAEAVAVNNWANFASNLAAGNSVELTASFSGSGATVQAGSNVTITMNGYTISHTSGSDTEFSTVQNNFASWLSASGTIHSGNIITVPSGTTVRIAGGGTISTSVEAGSSSSGNSGKKYYTRAQTIYNQGSLTIDGTNITANSRAYSTNHTYSETALAVAVYNNGGNVTLNAGTIKADAKGEPRSKKPAFSGNEKAWGAAFAAGVYSPTGTVTVNGGNINVTGNCDPNDGPDNSSENCYLQAYSAGIELQGGGYAYMNGGSITADTTLWNDIRPYTGTHYKSAVGIATTQHNRVTITGITANISTGFAGSGSRGSVVSSQYAVGTPASGNTTAGYKNILDDYGVVQSFTDTSINNSWVTSERKVLHYYRFYSGANQSSGYEQLSFADTNAWMKQRVTGAINLNGRNGAHFSGTLNTSLSPDAGFVNPNYYDTYTTTYVVYSSGGINHNTYGTVFSTLPTSSVAAGRSVIVYYNFFKKNPLQLNSFEVSNYQFPYLGREVVPGQDFGFKVLSNGVDESDKFNITGADTGKAPVIYSHRIPGAPTFTPGLPKNVGLYDIKAVVANDSTYSSSSRNIGPYEANFQIEIQKLVPTVEVNSFDLIYGNSLDSLGSKRVGEAGAIGNAYLIPPGGGAPIQVDGVFQWDVNSSAGYTRDVNAAGYAHGLTFIPDEVNNVEQVYVDVNVKVSKRPLTVQANTVSSATYGDDVAASYGLNHGMNVTITGAAPHDNASAWLSDITYIMDINNDGVFGQVDYYAFADLENTAAGTKEWWRRFETPAGTYKYRADSSINEYVNKNYEISCPVANFVVAKRQLTAQAVPVGRAYVPGNTSVDVNFEITGGLPTGTSNIHANPVISTMQGQIPSAAAGTYTVTISGQPLVTTGGSANSSYTVTITNISSSTVEIGKAQPVLVAPEFTADMVYDSMRTLGSLESQLTNHSSNIPGEWRWVYNGSATSTTIPQVGNGGYFAKFYPDASVSGNYAESPNTLIAVPIIKRTVNVTSLIYNSNDNIIEDWTLIYGDAAPRAEIVFSGFAEGESAANVVNTLTGNSVAAAFSVGTNYAQYSGASSSAYKVTISGAPEAVNYNFNVTRDESLVVNKKQLTVRPILTWSNLTYGDPVPNINILNLSYTGLARESDMNDLDLSARYNETNYEAGSNVANGHYYVKVGGGIASNNYELVYPSIYFDVVPKTLRVSARPITIEYGDNLPETHADDFEINSDDFVLGHHLNPSAVISGVPELSCPTYSQWAPVGQYSIDIAIGTLAAVGGNYNFELVDDHVFLTVKKASVAIITNPAVSVPNTKTLAEAIIIPGVVEANVQSGSSDIPGSWVFVDPALVPEFYGQTLNTYEIYFVPRQDYQDRYDNSAVILINVEVLPTPMSGEVGIYGSPMVGETLNVVVDALTPNEIYEYFCQWYQTDAGGNRTAISGANGYSFTIGSELEGMRIDVVVTLRPGAPYTGSRTSALTEEISAVKPVPNTSDFSLLANGGVYNGNPYSAQYSTALEGLGQITVKYNNSTDLPVNAGRYRITLDIASSASYGPVVGLYLDDLVIYPRDLNFYVGAQSKTYDSTTNATLTGVNIIDNLLPQDEGKVSIFTSTIRAVFSKADASNNAQLTVSGGILTGDAAGNYVLKVLQQQAAVVIAKAEIRATALTLDRDYSPDDYKVGVEFSEFFGVFYSDSGLQPAAGNGTIANNTVGEHKVNVVEADFALIGSGAHNYYLTITNKDNLYANISLATPEVSTPVFESIEYSGLKLSQQFTLGEYWQWENPDEIAQVNKAQYTLIYDLENTNYEVLEIPVIIEVEPAQLVLDVQDKSITYGDQRPTSFEVSYSGFKGADTKESVLKGTQGFYLDYDRGDNAGDYEITLNDTLYADNYDINLISGTLHVGKKDVYTTFSVISRMYEPGNTTVQLIAGDLTGRVFDYDPVYISNSRPLGYLESANAGENQTVTHFDPISLIGSKSGNYNLVITNVDDLHVTIEKASPAGYRFPGSASIEYGLKLGDAVFENYAGDGSFVYIDEQLVPNSIGIFNQFEVRFVPTDAANYHEITAFVPLTVNVADVSSRMSVSIVGTMLVGETLNASIAGLNEEARSIMQVRWIRVDEEGGSTGVIVGDELTYTVTQEDVGKLLKLEVSLNGNYAGYKEAYTADRAVQVLLSFWQKLIAWINSILLAFGNIGRLN